ncbi:MAG: DUF4157 domain-containing protein [Bacteroidetes bacterium]|nr:DUF4157 domain-containing protein [Bacteroidota bacterium]
MQKKLQVGATNDPLETEADAVAAQVMSTPAGKSIQMQVSRGSGQASMSAVANCKCTECEAEDKLQRKEKNQRDLQSGQVLNRKEKDLKVQPEGGTQPISTPAPDHVDAGVRATQGGGSPLPMHVHREMGTKMGADFSAVRIHTGNHAAGMNDAIGARAFTVGSNIYFNQGEYDPSSPSGKHLLAHELTHTIQQGAAVSRKEKTAQKAEPEAQRGAGDWLAERAWGIFESLVPTEFYQIVRDIWDRGVINWLLDKLKEGLNSVFDAFPAVGNFVTNLTSVFGDLYTRMSGILAALMAGDCQPLFAALTELKNIISAVATDAWNGLVDFVRPIGTFFSGLWTSYGAPVMEWLSHTASDIWQWMQNIGQRIWDWTQPVRDYGSMAWNWLKGVIGIGENNEGAENNNGIIQWISGKAQDAWNGLKQVLNPVIEPIQEVATSIVSILPLDAIMNLRDTVQGWFQGVNSMAATMGEDPSAIEQQANQASLRDTILPAVLQSVVSVQQGIAGAGQWISEKVGGFAGQISGFISGLASSEWFSFVGNALSWVSDAATSLGTWVQQGVVSLFTGISNGLGYLASFITPILNALQRIVDTITNLMGRIGDFVLGPFMLIPECIRTPIKNFLLEQILARIPLFNQLTAIGDAWTRLQTVAMTILYQVFVNGDLFGAVWTFFRSMLGLLGIPPELVVSILANASSAVVDILGNPLGFFVNLGRGVLQGFSQFFDNIGTHLLNGVVNWLTGQMQSIGIQPPADFSFGSIFGFILQILGITVDNIFRLLATRIGEERAARLRSMLDMATGAWAFVRDVVERGPVAIWERIQEQLSNLWNMVITNVVTYISERIMAQATIWLLGLLDISGIMPVVNTLIAVYRAIQSFVEYFVPILQIVNQYMGMLADVASGNVAGAANFLEQLLENALPIIIGFCASQFGFGNLAHRMSEILGAIRERIDNGILWVIDQAIRIGGAIMDMGRSAVSAVTGWVRGVLGLEKRFQGRDNHNHRLFFRESNGTAQLMINPDPAGPFETWVNAVHIDPAGDPGGERATAKANAITKARLVDAKNTQIRTAASTAPGGTLDPDHQLMRDQRDLLDSLSLETGKLFVALPVCGNDRNGGVTYNPTLTHGYGTSMEARNLTKNGLAYGSGPFDNTNGTNYHIINRRRYGNGSYYVKGHLLNDNLGGSGNTWTNLTPLKGSVNTALHERIVEARVKNAVTAGNIVNYSVRAVYGRNNAATLKAAVDNYTPPDPAVYDKVKVKEVIDAEMEVPVSLVCNATMLDPANPSGTPAPLVNNVTIANTLDQNPADYSLVAGSLPSVKLSQKDENRMNLIPEIGNISGFSTRIKDAFLQRESQTDPTRFPSFAVLSTYTRTGGGAFFSAAEQAVLVGFASNSRVTMY